MTSQNSDDTAATFWDQRFGASHYVYGKDPNEFLVRQRYRLDRGMDVLAVADGEGRNGVWLAQQGMKVTTVDASPEGVKKSLRLALDRGVTLRASCADLTDWDWPVAAFDSVVSVFLHLSPDVRPQVHRQMAAALRPGGLLMLEAFRPEQLDHGTGGPKNPALLYTVEMLRQDFADLEILDITEAAPELDEGPFHQGKGATVQMVARRP